MAFIDDEVSAYGSRPVEGYVLTLGPTVLYLTNQQVAATLDGAHSHVPVQGLTRRAIVRKEIGAGGSELEVRMARSYLAAFFPDKQPNPYTIVITRYQLGGSQVVFSGDVSQTRVEDAEVLLRCVSKTERLMARRCPGLSVTPKCGRTLYDSWCRKDRTDYTFPVDIVNVDGLVVEVSTASGKADGYFSGGEMVKGTEKRTITTHVGTALTIDYPFNAGLVVDETVTTHPGCDKTLATCRDKYDNNDNFQGAPFQPDQNIHVLGVNGMRVTVT